MVLKKKNRRDVEYNELNIGKLQRYIDLGRIDPTKKITLKEISESGVCGKLRDGVKLLGRVYLFLNCR